MKPSLLWIFVNPASHSNVPKTALRAATALRPREHTYHMTFLLFYQWGNGGKVIVSYQRRRFLKAVEAHLPLAFPSAVFLPKQGSVSWIYERNPPRWCLVQSEHHHHQACGPSRDSSRKPCGSQWDSWSSHRAKWTRQVSDFQNCGEIHHPELRIYPVPLEHP